MTRLLRPWGGCGGRRQGGARITPCSAVQCCSVVHCRSVKILKEGGGGGGDGLEELGSDSESSGNVSVQEGELEWLERDLGGIIAMEDPRARTMDLLRSVQVQLQEARGQRQADTGVTADRVDGGDWHLPPDQRAAG